MQLVPDSCETIMHLILFGVKSDADLFQHQSLLTQNEQSRLRLSHIPRRAPVVNLMKGQD